MNTPSATRARPALWAGSAASSRSARALEQVLNALRRAIVSKRVFKRARHHQHPHRVLVVNGIRRRLVSVANARRLVGNLRTSAPAASAR